MSSFDPKNIIFKNILGGFVYNFFIKKPRVFEKNKLLTVSGKSAIFLILKFLKQRKYIENKTSPIFVPKWMGYYIYNVMQEICSPSYSFNKEIKIYYAYHQFGYPQNMDKTLDFCKRKKLILVEDCAHALKSSYKNKQVGTFGDFSLFSFSKFLYCHSLGAVTVNKSAWKKDFVKLYKEEISNSPYIIALLISLQKFLTTLYPSSRGFQKTNKIFYNLYVNNPAFIKNSVYLLKKNLKFEVNKREKYYKNLLKEFNQYSIFDHLKKKGESVVPWAIPLIAKKNMDKINNELNSYGISSGFYNFDTNRFSVNPRFKKSLMLPINFKYNHQFEQMMDIIKKNL